MAFFKCKMCGGDLDISEGMSVAECQYCGTKQTLPKLNDDKKATLYDRASHFRRNNEFDKAMGIYEQILNEDNTDAEAYWSLVLCRYGIEYVEDPASRKRIPTVNRAQFTSVFDDENYKSALQYADGYQRSIYEEEAKAINEIQKGILAISQQEEPFDVFICYKETDANGRRTPDSVLANDLYYQLTQEGFKVFFARITLEDKLGTAYEPYIFAALNSAKVMVVLGTKPEYFNAVWVRNEWSRYLALIKSGAKKMLIPAYKDMDPYDLPEEFAHLQSQDMSKLGFMQDLIRGIKKIASVDEPKTVVREVVQGGGTDKATLLKRVSLFLIDGDWKSANEYCEKVLDTDPECAEAYLYKLMAEMHVNKESDIGKQLGTIKHNSNYNKIILFGNDELKTRLEEYDNSCKYNYAVSVFHDHNYVSAKILFEKLNGYKDSEIKITGCIQKIEQEQVEKEKQKREIENLRKENEQVDDKKRNLNKKLQSLSNLSGWMITLFLFITVVGGYLFVTGANDSELGIMFGGLIAAIVGIIALVLVLKPISKKKTAIRAELTAVDSATQANAITIRNYESSKPLINTFPDIVPTQTISTKSTKKAIDATPSPSAPSFLMTISDTFFITGRGTVVAGTISVGTIIVGDTVQINGNQYRILGIEAKRQVLQSASAGMMVGLLIDSGNVRFNPGSNVIMMTDTSSGSSWHDVVLLDAGANKIQVIAAIRELTGLGLADAKALTDVVPSTVKRSVSPDEASRMKYQLESAGARVNIQ